MKKKVNVLEQDNKNSQHNNNQCRHHWIIEFATGPTSLGRCKHCGATKTFYNIVEDAQSKDDLSRFFDRSIEDIEGNINYN